MCCSILIEELQHADRLSLFLSNNTFYLSKYKNQIHWNIDEIKQYLL